MISSIPLPIVKLMEYLEAWESEKWQIMNDGEYEWGTSITLVEPNRILIKGYRIQDLMGNVTYPDMINLLIKGELPSEPESTLLNDIFVASSFIEIPDQVIDYVSFVAPTSSIASTVASGLRGITPL
jgi:citrate synthase